jgi:hypothetical protein
MDISRAAAHVRAQAAAKVQIKLLEEQAGNDAPVAGGRVAVPAMFDALVEAASRIAIGGNNSTSRPARGRLMQVLKMYADHQQIFNEKSFYKLLTVEFRGIPESSHPGLFRYVSRHQPSFPLTHLLNMLIPDGFTKEKSVLDFPCTIENVAKKESLEDAAEEIRLEMIQHLRTKRISMREYFAGIDTDGSGSVDMAELLASLRHDNMGIGRYHACKNLVSRFDQSGRGRLTFGDFEQMLALASPKSQLRLERLGIVPARAVGSNVNAKGSGGGGSSGKKHRSASANHRSPDHQRGGQASPQALSAMQQYQAMAPAAGVSTSPINAHTRTSPFTVEAAGAGAGSTSSLQVTGSTRSPVVSPAHNRSPSPPPNSSTVRRSPSLSGGRLSAAVGSSVRKSPSFAGRSELPSPFSKNFELHQKAWGGV